MAGAGMRDEGGVSAFETPPRLQQEEQVSDNEKNKEEEESQDIELDTGSDAAVGFGHEPTSDGPSVEFSSVSSSAGSGPGDTQMRMGIHGVSECN